MLFLVKCDRKLNQRVYECLSVGDVTLGSGTEGDGRFYQPCWSKQSNRLFDHGSNVAPEIASARLTQTTLDGDQDLHSLDCFPRSCCLILG